MDKKYVMVPFDISEEKSAMIDNIQETKGVLDNQFAEFYYSTYTFYMRQYEEQYKISYELLKSKIPPLLLINEIDLWFKVKNPVLKKTENLRIFKSRISFVYQMNLEKQELYTEMLKCYEDHEEYPVSSCMESSHRYNIHSTQYTINPVENYEIYTKANCYDHYWETICENAESKMNLFFNAISDYVFKGEIIDYCYVDLVDTHEDIRQLFIYGKVQEAYYLIFQILEKYLKNFEEFKQSRTGDFQKNEYCRYPFIIHYYNYKLYNTKACKSYYYLKKSNDCQIKSRSENPDTYCKLLDTLVCEDMTRKDELYLRLLTKHYYEEINTEMESNLKQDDYYLGSSTKTPGQIMADDFNTVSNDTKADFDTEAGMMDLLEKDKSNKDSYREFANQTTVEETNGLDVYSRMIVENEHFDPNEFTNLGDESLFITELISNVLGSGHFIRSLLPKVLFNMWLEATIYFRNMNLNLYYLYKYIDFWVNSEELKNEPNFYLMMPRAFPTVMQKLLVFLAIAFIVIDNFRDELIWATFEYRKNYQKFNKIKEFIDIYRVNCNENYIQKGYSSRDTDFYDKWFVMRDTILMKSWYTGQILKNFNMYLNQWSVVEKKASFWRYLRASILHVDMDHLKFVMFTYVYSFISLYGFTSSLMLCYNLFVIQQLSHIDAANYMVLVINTIIEPVIIKYFFTDFRIIQITFDLYQYLAPQQQLINNKKQNYKYFVISIAVLSLILTMVLQKQIWYIFCRGYALILYTFQSANWLVLTKDGKKSSFYVNKNNSSDTRVEILQEYLIYYLMKFYFLKPYQMSVNEKSSYLKEVITNQTKKKNSTLVSTLLSKKLGIKTIKFKQHDNEIESIEQESDQNMFIKESYEKMQTNNKLLEEIRTKFNVITNKINNYDKKQD